MITDDQVAGIRRVDAVTDLEPTDPPVVLLAGGRVVLDLPADAADHLAKIVIRHDVFYSLIELGDRDEWIHTAMRLLVAAAVVREPKPAPVLVPLRGTAS